MADEKIVKLLEELEGASVTLIEMLALPEQLEEIERVLHTSTLDEIRRGDIERRMFGMTSEEAEKTLQMLYENQHVTDREMYKRIRNHI
jgi:hypothetical protein